MREFLVNSTFFGAFLTLAIYELGLFLKKKTGWTLMNPLLIGMIGVIVVLCCLDIDYDTYNQGASYITYFLTPATVSLALPLYEQMHLLKKYRVALIAGLGSGVLTSGFSVLALCVLFRLDHTMYVTLIPKSITTAIGMGLSEELGGIATITVAVIAITGIIGNIMAETICRIFKITEPVAIGIGIGSSAHAMGTARAMEMGEIQGAMSSLSIAVAGIMTTLAASFFAMLY